MPWYFVDNHDDAYRYSAKRLPWRFGHRRWLGQMDAGYPAGAIGQPRLWIVQWGHIAAALRRGLRP